MSRWLVTGGAGFIGGHLTRLLLAQGDQVVILDDFSSGDRANVAQGAALIEASVTDAETVATAAQGCDGIFHLAALVSVPECVERWQDGHRINIGGTINVFQAALAAGRIPVVYASSAAIYGDQGDALCREDSLPCPISPYGADKLGCEHHARAFWLTRSVPSVGLRFFNVYGPGQSIRSPYAGVVARFCANALSGTPHVIHGDGGQTRDFVYVGDVVRVLAAAPGVLAAAPGALVSNVCANSATSIRDLTSILDNLVPCSVDGLSFVEGRVGDIRVSRGDDAVLRQTFGFGAQTPMLEGLRRTLDHARDKG